MKDEALASFAVMKAVQKSKAARPIPRLTPAIRHLAWAGGMRSKGTMGARSMKAAVTSAASLGVMPT